MLSPQVDLSTKKKIILKGTKTNNYLINSMTQQTLLKRPLSSKTNFNTNSSNKEEKHKDNSEQANVIMKVQQTPQVSSGKLPLAFKNCIPRSPKRIFQGQDNENQNKNIRKNRVNEPSQNDYFQESGKKQIQNKEIKRQNSEDFSKEINDRIQNKISLNEKNQQQIPISKQSIKQSQPSMTEQLENFQKIRPQLNENITLQHYKTSKKVLHAPSLELFFIKEIQLTDKLETEKYKQYLKMHQELLQNSSFFIRTAEFYFNQPENHISILQEYLNKGSLITLLDSAVTLNEQALVELAQGVLLGLKEFHSMVGKQLNGLSPSQIFFNDSGQVKIGLCIKNKFSKDCKDKFRLEQSKIKQLFSSKSRIRSPVVANSKFTVENNCNKKEELIHTEDIFDLGLILLTCIVGDFNFISKKVQLRDNMERNNNMGRVSSPKQNEIKKCCLLHTILYNSKESPNQNLDLENCFLISYLVKKQFSQKLINFICKCLRSRENEREKPERLLEDEIFQQTTFFPPLSLKNMINLVYNSMELLTEQLDKICQNIQIVLPFCDRYYKFRQGRNLMKKLTNLSPADRNIQILSKELNSNEQILIERLSASIKETNIYHMYKQQSLYQGIISSHDINGSQSQKPKFYETNKLQ